MWQLVSTAGCSHFTKGHKRHPEPQVSTLDKGKCWWTGVEVGGRLRGMSSDFKTKNIPGILAGSSLLHLPLADFLTVSPSLVQGQS